MCSSDLRHVPIYRRPRWDGFAYITYAEQADIERTLGQEKFDKRIVADEQVAFRMVTREIAREYILIPSARHRDPVSLVMIHRCAPGMSREAFQQRMLGEHARLVMAQPSTRELVLRYAQLHNIGSTQEDPEGSRIDAVSVLSFASLNDVEDFLVSADYPAIAASLETLQGEGSEWWTAINYSVINRLGPEVTTELTC